MRTARVIGIGTVVGTLALGLGAAGPAQADVNGIKVREAYEPVAFRLCTAEGPNVLVKCQTLGDPPSRTVPAGRRLVIEQVSGECASDVSNPVVPPTAEILAQTGGTVVPHAIVLVPFASLPGGLVPLTLTRIYADPGSQVTIGLDGLSGEKFCRMSFSGQLVRP
ncbi:MAG TPA: hypothetical protein VIB60_04285 [Methylomirabilota bacterium]|jgi:hypothetical protein